MSACERQVPWKCDAENEDKIKAETKATIRCYPFEHNKTPPTGQQPAFLPPSLPHLSPPPLSPRLAPFVAA